MARNERSADEFEGIANELSQAAESLRAISKLMRESELPAALIHGSTTFNRYLPSVLQWVDKTTADVRAQVRAYLSGVPSKAEIMKQHHAEQQLIAAKRPPKKPGT